MILTSMGVSTIGDNKSTSERKMNLLVFVIYFDIMIEFRKLKGERDV
jgi:hypothetical protein